MITLAELEAYHGEDDREVLLPIILELLNGERTVEEYQNYVNSYNEE